LKLFGKRVKIVEFVLVDNAYKVGWEKDVAIAEG
jgi:hypothetical protein